MRYVSQIFQPILTIPKNAKIKNTEITCKSQKLLLECGLVRPTSSGLFTLLPLAQRALDKLEQLVRTCFESEGAQQISLPSLTPEALWQRSGRLKDAPELMRVSDRHGKRFLLAPTHEEAIADLLADVGPLSYKQLPLFLYQISNKYRDEHRPKHGLLRAREFLMADAYSAHAHVEEARARYGRVGGACARLFQRLRLPVRQVEAPTGDMGGSLSHEWQLEAEAGEDAIDVCPSCSHALLASEERKSQCEKCGSETRRVNSIEVGHTFILGTKYSEPLKACFTTAQGTSEPLVMACYGIGLTRLLAASLEALSTDTSLRWPTAIAPYHTIIIGPKEGSKEWSEHGPAQTEALARALQAAPAPPAPPAPPAAPAAPAGALQTAATDVLIDDRHHLTVGKRLLMAEKMGYPRIIVCGRSILESPPTYEVHACAPQGGRGQAQATPTQLIEGGAFG